MKDTWFPSNITAHILDILNLRRMVYFPAIPNMMFGLQVDHKSPSHLFSQLLGSLQLVYSISSLNALILVCYLAMLGVPETTFSRMGVEFRD